MCLLAAFGRKPSGLLFTYRSYLVELASSGLESRERNPELRIETMATPVLNVVGPYSTVTGKKAKKGNGFWKPGPGEVGYREKFDLVGCDDFSDGPAVLREFPNGAMVADSQGLAFLDERFNDPDQPVHYELDREFSGHEEAKKYLQSLPDAFNEKWLRKQGFVKVEA